METWADGLQILIRNFCLLSASLGYSLNWLTCRVQEKRRKAEDVTSNASNVIYAGSSEEVCTMEEEGFLDVF